VRAFLLSVVAAAVALGAAAAGAQTTRASSDAPRLSEIGRYVKFKDSSVSKLASVLSIPDTWPFSETTSTGETVSINLSKSLYLSPDPTVAQQWANFFGNLLHGPELSDLDVYLLSPREIENVCGPHALACYGGNRLLIPPNDPSSNLSAEAVATHEYGHHVANHRLNDPWDAIDYGTKRWASYEQVCLKTRKGDLYPGAEDETHYELNPGEGFAESYRVLNEQRAGVPEAPWNIVTRTLYPNATALRLLTQDVTSPWTKSTTLVRSGSVSAKKPTSNLVVSTPLDGRLKLALRSSARVRFDLLSPSSTRLAQKLGRTASVSRLVCGQRAFRVRVSRVAGAGAFRLTVSRP
jgi:hypothetical protein